MWEVLGFVSGWWLFLGVASVRNCCSGRISCIASFKPPLVCSVGSDDLKAPGAGCRSESVGLQVSRNPPPRFLQPCPQLTAFSLPQCFFRSSCFLFQSHPF